MRRRRTGLRAITSVRTTIASDRVLDRLARAETDRPVPAALAEDPIVPAALENHRSVSSFAPALRRPGRSGRRRLADSTMRLGRPRPQGASSGWIPQGI